MYFEGGYTYSNFLMNMLGIFAFVVWFWLLVIIYGDLFRRHEHFRMGQSALGTCAESYLLFRHFRLSNHSRKGHGRT